MSLVAIVIISVITNYTGKLIIECLYEKPFNEQGTRGIRLRNSYALIGEFILKLIRYHLRSLDLKVSGSRSSPCHRVVSLEEKLYPKLSLFTPVYML